jgi:hypothetical protein
MKHDFKKKSDGTIDTVAMSEGFHNGPICKVCGEYFCEHCNPERMDEECPGKPGFRFSVRTKYLYERGLGIFWRYKVLTVHLIFVNLVFDFTGLFPYAEDGDDC